MTEITPFSEREWVMAGALAAVLVFSLIGFFARSRVSLRFHSALSIFSILVMGFTLLLAVTSALPQNPLLSVGSVAFLALLFKIMNQFEIKK